MTRDEIHDAIRETTSKNIESMNALVVRALEDEERRIVSQAQRAATLFQAVSIAAALIGLLLRDVLSLYQAATCMFWWTLGAGLLTIILFLVSALLALRGGAFRDYAVVTAESVFHKTSKESDDLYSKFILMHLADVALMNRDTNNTRAYYLDFSHKTVTLGVATTVLFFLNLVVLHLSK